MDVFQYLDPYLVMQTYYADRKATDPKFSYTIWSQELGLKSSSTLRMMVNRKKRLSFGVIDKFSRQCFQSKDEQNYFHLLATYVHALNTHERASAWNSLSQILAGRISQQEVRDYFNYVSDLLTPKLLTMLSFDDQVWTEGALADALDEKIETLRATLEKLSGMDLVIATENELGEKSWKATQRLIKVSDLPGDVALKAYHNASLDEAKEAQLLPVETRKYRSLLVPLSQDEFAELSAEINTFVSRILSKYQSDQYRERRLFKLNLNYFPVSK